MKHVLTFILITSSFLFSYSQTKILEPSPSIGCLVNYGYYPSKTRAVTGSVRALFPVFKRISLGTEINYSETFGKYSNHSYLGGIAFARINTFKGLFAELGYGINRQISSSRIYLRASSALFLSAGYRIKVSPKVNIEAHYRFIPTKYEQENASTRIFVGATFSLK